MNEENPAKPAASPADDMAEKRQLHAKADEKNRIELRRGKKVLVCGSRRPKKGPDAYCRSLAGMGTQHPGYGRCKFCFGTVTQRKGPTSPEAKAKVSQNARKHGFYSDVLSPAEAEVYEGELDSEALSLQHEIYMLKAKIKVYLGNWRRKWQGYYDRKAAEFSVKYDCSNPDCKWFHVIGSLDPAPGYCPRCGDNRPVEVERWAANPDPGEAEAYADRMSRVWYSEGEGARSYYHAGTLEDRTLNTALNTLSRLVEKHARLNPDGDTDMITKINEELRGASKGRISISWGGGAQSKVNPVTEGGGQDGGGGKQAPGGGSAPDGEGR